MNIKKRINVKLKFNRMTMAVLNRQEMQLMGGRTLDNDCYSINNQGVGHDTCTSGTTTQVTLECNHSGLQTCNTVKVRECTGA